MSIDLLDVDGDFGLFGFGNGLLGIGDVLGVGVEIVHVLLGFMAGNFGELGDVPVFDFGVHVFVERNEEEVGVVVFGDVQINALFCVFVCFCVFMPVWRGKNDRWVHSR